MSAYVSEELPAVFVAEGLAVRSQLSAVGEGEAGDGVVPVIERLHVNTVALERYATFAGERLLPVGRAWRRSLFLFDV